MLSESNRARSLVRWSGVDPVICNSCTALAMRQLRAPEQPTETPIPAAGPGTIKSTRIHLVLFEVNRLYRLWLLPPPPEHLFDLPSCLPYSSSLASSLLLFLLLFSLWSPSTFKFRMRLQLMLQSVLPYICEIVLFISLFTPFCAHPSAR